MFTVKAVVDGGGMRGHAEIFQAEKVVVRPAGSTFPTHHPDGRPYLPEQFLVTIEGGPQHGDILSVGEDQFCHYQTIYVMNERGATVETIRASAMPKSAMAA